MKERTHLYLVLVLVLVLGIVVVLGAVFILGPRLIPLVESELEDRLGIQLTLGSTGWSPLAGWTIDRVLVEHSRGQAVFWDLEIRMSTAGLWAFLFRTTGDQDLGSSPIESLRVGTYEVLVDMPSAVEDSDLESPTRGSAAPINLPRLPSLGLFPEILEFGPGQVSFPRVESLLVSIPSFSFVREGARWSFVAEIQALGGTGTIESSGENSLLPPRSFRGSLDRWSVAYLESLRALGYLPSWSGLLTSGQGSLTFEGESMAHDQWGFSGDFSVDSAILDWSVFSTGPVTFPPIHYSFSGIFDPQAAIGEPSLVPTPDPPGNRRGSLIMTEGELTLGQVRGEVRPQLYGVFGEPKRIGVFVDLPRTPVQNLIRSVPPEVLGDFVGLEVGGYFSWQLELEIPVDRLSHMQWVSKPLVEDFSILTFPRRYSPFRLNEESTFLLESGENQSFILEIDLYVPSELDLLSVLAEQVPSRLVARNQQLQDQLSPPNRITGVENPRFLDIPEARRVDFVPLSQMGPWIPRAVLTGEDGDFFFHSGIDWNTFRSAIERNLRTGEVEFGASTLSMQLVKNLFLVQDQELVRKIQEAFLVYLLEHRAGISKERILELYLNIAPFGPQVYGVGEGARYYFGKDPEDLTILEAVWMASMLPSPLRYSQFIRDRAPADFWRPRLQFLLDIMLERERISPADYENSNPADLRFRQSR